MPTAAFARAQRAVYTCVSSAWRSLGGDIKSPAWFSEQLLKAPTDFYFYKQSL